tara:strand:+ start:878 stop:1249 length:372 start_codon:yes stop_codon:yes gene_type:complete
MNNKAKKEIKIQSNMVTIQDKEYYKQNIDGKIGTLMFPSEYRQFTEFDKKDYQKFRKRYKLKGRIKLFIHSNFNEKNKPKQNKELKYEYARIVGGKDWEGAYLHEPSNRWITDYPYGEIIVIV